MKRRQISFITIASVAAILLVVRGTVVNRSTSASTSYREAFPPQAGEAVSAVSGAADLAAEGDWPMAAANPQRTSWTSEEVGGRLRPIWYRPIDPYINYKIQVIAANDTLYVSTARGLYALSTVDLDGDGVGGEVRWIYPTELPLGHSPTVVDDVVYVGGYDRKIHAIDATTGEMIPTWAAYEAEAGFETNPLVIDETVYAGNRDGYMYALDAITGNLRWKYKTDGPILFSAAYQDNTIYFASNDSHAYALTADTGTLVWKSAKLTGAGFHSYWPVIYQDYVIFAGSKNYREGHYNSSGVTGGWPMIGYRIYEKAQIFPNYELDPRGTLVGPVGTEPGDWVEGTMTIDTSQPNVTENGSTRPITEYLEEPSEEEALTDPAGLQRPNHKPWRRTVFVLNRFTGEEFTFDSDNDGMPEYAPFLWFGPRSGNRYPFVIGSDGVLYQSNFYMSSQSGQPGGQVVGWKFGTPFISRVSGNWHAADEPPAYSAGGNLVYWGNCRDRAFGSFDITIPYGNPERHWMHFSYDLDERIPGYDIKYYRFGEYPDGDPIGTMYGSPNGVYDSHGAQNPPIPYKGKVYMQRGNSIVAFAVAGETPVQLPMLQTVAVEDPPSPITTDHLKQRLAEEVEKMLAAGHLRPGYHSTGSFDASTIWASLGDYLIDYWHNPADTLYTLIMALPHLPDELKQSTRDYLQQEFADYPPYEIAHIGWQDGAAREAFDLPPELEQQTLDFAPRTTSRNIWNQPNDWWSFPPGSFYGLWKYAQEFGGANEIFDEVKNKLETPPADGYLADHPYIHNAYIAGYIGYLELEEMAGEPESADVRAELDRLLNLRATNFSKDHPFDDHTPALTLNVARNSMYLVPELADYLRRHALAEVQEAVDEYHQVAPYWFVSKYDATYCEGLLQVLYDYHSIFQAKALILKESREELAKYLDAPAFARGDLFYIQNLVATIEAPPGLEKTVTPSFGYQGSSISYTLRFFTSGITLTLTDTLPLGVSAPDNFELEGTSIVPTYDSGRHRLAWSDTPPAGHEVTIRYTVTITTSDRQALVNTAELHEAGGDTSTATTIFIANPHLAYLPLTVKHHSGNSQGTADFP